MMAIGVQNSHVAHCKPRDGQGQLSTLDTGVPFYSQYHAMPPNQPRSSLVPMQVQHMPPGYSSTPGQMYGPSAFHMGPLPSSHPSLQGSLAQQHQSQQFIPSGYTASNPTMLITQPVSYQAQYQMSIAPQHVFPSGASMPGYATAYQAFHQQQPSPIYQPSSYGLHPNHSGFLFSDQVTAPSSHYSERALGIYGSEISSVSPSQQIFGAQFGPATNASSADVTAVPGVPRGPPRKPRQSGHALWVGNLPLGARVIDLKDHFSREATKDIESLKLISKSNCAFVNYRTQAACTAAMARFHDSRFHGTRLVCRLRRTSTTSPSAVASDASPVDNSPESPLSVAGAQPLEEPIVKASEDPTLTRVPARYFILKSLTLQDLEISTRTGIWATQTHNEELLSNAYNTAEEVFLVFSANKSGEYFGFARMTSAVLPTSSLEPITVERRCSIVEPEPAAPSQQGAGPKSIPTPATEWAPRGRIIDDSARGTIFWEADLDQPTNVGEIDSCSSDSDSIAKLSSSSSSKPVIVRSTAAGAVPIGHTAPAQDDSKDSKGNSFRVEWLSTRKMPFYRTRGLRNTWNASREVKIARDGTELEPAVGKKLVGLFAGLPHNPRTATP